MGQSHGECAPIVFTEGCYIYLILNIKKIKMSKLYHVMGLRKAFFSLRVNKCTLEFIFRVVFNFGSRSQLVFQISHLLGKERKGRSV